MQLGYASVRRMISEAGRWQLAQWLALYEVNPWGENRADLRAAIGHTILANSNRDRAAHPEPFRRIDFMPYAKRPPEDESLSTGRLIAFALADLDGGRKGAELKAWRSEQRKRVGSARAEP